MAGALCLSAALSAQTPAPRARVTPQDGAIPFEIESVVRGGSYLGVLVLEVDADRAKELGLKDVNGVEITSVEKDSPAEKAGLKAGDVVLEYQGQRVEGTQQFVRLVQETPTGRQVKMTVVRAGASQTLTATIGSRKAVARSPFPQVAGAPMITIPDIPRAFTSWRSPVLGVEAESVDGQLAGYFGVKKGVLVRSVISGSAAEKAGVKAGDVILKVGNDEVSTPGELSNAIRSGSSKDMTLGLMREHKEMSVPVTVDQGQQERPRTRSVSRPDEF